MVLTVTNACNCQHSVKHTVHVGKKSVNIQCPAVVCEGQSANYYIKDIFANGCTSYDWDVQGGIITSPQPYGESIDILWKPSGAINSTIDGFGYVTFDPTHCGLDCYVRTALKIPVITDNMPFEGPTSICRDSQNRYTMPQWPTTDFVWEVVNGSGTNASVIYTDQRNEIILDPGSSYGTITLRVTYQNTLLNCGGTSEKQIEIKKSYSISGRTEVCLGESETYQIESLQSVNWTLKRLPNGPTVSGSGTSFNHLFTTAGNYSLTISGASICTSEAMIIKVKSLDAPTDAAILGSRIVCPSAPSTFSIVNSVPDTVIGWSIDPGLGTIVGSSYGDEVQVLFNYPTVPPNSPYEIKVWRESAINSTCPSEQLIIPLAPEQLDLTITGEAYPCGSSRHQYQLPSSVIADTFEWSIDPTTAGSIITNGGRVIEVLWNQFGAAQNAIIRVKATKCNIESTSSDYNVVIDNPRIQIVVPTTPICPRTSQTFMLSSSVPLSVSDQNIIWDFGDISQPVIGPTVTHVFSSSGTYTVRVRVIEPNGCLTTLTQTTSVVVLPQPTVVVAPSAFEACTSPVNVSISAQVGASVISVAWYEFGNPAVLATTNTIMATNYGTYTVVVSDGTCTNSASAIVSCPDPSCTVGPPVSLGLSVSANCETITAVGSYPSGPVPIHYSWHSNFRTDHLTAADMTHATFSFEEPGQHVIKYGVQYDELFCFNDVTASIFIPYVARVKTTVGCGPAGSNNYLVTLTDDSLLASGVVLQTYVFELDGQTIVQGSDPANIRIVSVPGGQHIIKLTISDGTNPPCTVEKTLDLPAFPNAAFTATPSPVCQQNSTKFTVNAPVAGQSYVWDFGDNTFNLQQNPEKEYTNVDEYFPSLTVTNAYCHATATGSIIVNANQQDGRINTPPISCPGGSSSLFFQSTGSPTSISYQWLLNNQPIAGATTNPYTGVTQSGSYSIEVGAVNLCKKRISKSVAVAIAKPPFTNILGPNSACEYQPFRLYVKAGSNTPGVIYQWRRTDLPGSVLSNTSSYSVAGLPAGTYTFTLNVQTPIATGGYCTSNLSHTVTVVENPTVTATGDIRNCEPYEVELIATVNQSGGVFNWSNGASGPYITDTNGGAFKVIYTSEAGCKASFETSVAKNPDNYMWIFPYGCYTFCNEFNTGTLIGPSIAYFDKWDWLKSDSPVLSGNGNDEVAPYDLGNTNATYNLQLETSPCKIVSKDMTVSILDCNCEVSAEIQNIEIKTDPFNQYLLTVFIANPTGIPQSVMVLADNNIGVITPGFVMVPAGGAEFVFNLLPETGFNGGTVVLKLKTTDADGNLCKGELELALPSFEDIGSIQAGQNTSPQSKLALVPNPSAGPTELHYDFGSLSGNNSERIEVYDLYGRLLDSLAPPTTAAVWQLNTNSYPAGIYIVVMKQAGKILQQKNLVMVR